MEKRGYNGKGIAIIAFSILKRRYTLGTVYSRVFSRRTGWVLGRIVDHVAEPITDPYELDTVCDQLNTARQENKQSPENSEENDHNIN